MTRGTTASQLTLSHRKKFTFRLEALPCFCIVMLFLALGFFHDAFRYGFTDIQEIFDLRLESRDVLKLKWKDELLNRPIFCNFKQAPTSIHLLKDEIFPYAKYRDIFVRLGRVAGFEYPLELYQLRRASGRNINRTFISTCIFHCIVTSTDREHQSLVTRLNVTKPWVILVMYSKNITRRHILPATSNPSTLEVLQKTS
jgi:hypothetical protein